jgi:tetratricopeptide (TPR) repeat protein
MHHLKYLILLFLISGTVTVCHAQTAADTAKVKTLGDSAEGRMVAGDFHAAISLYTLQMRSPLRMGVFWYNRANAESFLSEYQNAARDYDTALSLDTTLVQAYMNQAYMYMQLHRTTEAMYAYEKGLKYRKADSIYQANMYISRGNAWLQLFKLQEAEKDFGNAIRYNKKSWQAWMQRGAVRRKLGKSKPALDDLNKANALKPKDPDILFLRGIVKSDLKNYKGAIADFNTTLKLRKNNDVYFYRGEARLKSGLDSLAREDFNKILALDKKNIAALNGRAEANYRLKHPKLSIRDYSAIIEINPKSGDAYANRAFVYSNTNEKAKGCADWQKASELGVATAKEGLKKYCGK